MKKSTIVTTIVASVISVSTCSVALAGCGSTEPYIFEYEVSVVGGTGSGTYKDGSDCSVTAEIPEGKKFEKWVNEYGEVLSVANPYTFKVDGDTEVYAVVSDMQTYKIEIVGGTITGTSDYEATVYAGEEVSVTANSTNSHKFREWLINGTEKSTANPYTFTATQDMKIEALVDESYLVAVSGGTIGDTEETRKIFESGEECTVVAGQAPAAGMEFVYWYVLDEDGNEKFVTSDTRYTFTVTGTDKYYAKFGEKRTVTVEGGIIEGYPGLTTISVLVGANVTIRLDSDNIPAGKGFIGWTIDGKTVSKDSTLRLTDIKADTVVRAEFADKVKYETPDMSANQIMRKRMSGGNENDYCLELDRMTNADGSKKSAFSENTDYVALYIYNSPFAGQNDWVGQMRIQSVDGVWQLATKDGEKLWNIEGAPGNMWIDTKDNFNQGKGHRGNTMAMFKRAIESCGNEYSANTPYYLAAQIVAKPYSLSGDSDISVIGPQSFIENDVAKSAVTITGGKIKGTDLTQITLFAGQQIVVVPTIENFRYWRINGEITEGEEQTITAGEEAITMVAVPDTMLGVTVNGGQIITEGINADEIEAGVVIAIRANEPETGKRFAGWYRQTSDGNEVKISDNEECEITVTETMTVTAKYINIYTVTVTNGLIQGMDKSADGKYILDEGTDVVIVPDWTDIPADKAFAGWQTGSDTVLNYWYHLSVNGDVTVTGLTEDTAQLATPVNENNEMFKVLANGIIEIDRRNTKKETEFVDAVDCIRMYFYNFTYADTSNALGYVDIIRNATQFYFADKDGNKLFNLKGKASDLYHDNAAEAGYPSLSDMLFALVKAAVGEGNFDANTPYYIAVQARSNDTKYTPSEISAIGPQAFIQNSVAQHTVTITGGKIKGTELTEVTLYQGQKITIVPDDTENFGGWMINDSFASTPEYELTVNGETVITVRDKGAEVTRHTVTVEGGTIGDNGATTLEAAFGTEITVTAAVPENKAFLYWYVLNGDTEEKVSESAVYTFEVAKDVTLIARFTNVYTLTVTGGAVTGDVEDGKVKENSTVRISLDLSAIPEGKGFTGWKIGDDVSQTAYEIEITVTADTTVEAIYADKVSQFAKPVNENNEMFRIGGNGAIEIDRKNKGVESEFDNPNIDHILFYFYDFSFVENTAENALGCVKLQRVVSGDSESFYFATMEGEKLWSLKGRKSDLYHDNPGEASNSIGVPGKYQSISDMIFALVKGAVGEANFNPDTPYYIAIQACGKEGSVYGPSEISAIGPCAFIQNNVAQHTVTVTDGTVSGTTLTAVTVYEGQNLTITTDNADFKFWIVNGEKFTERTCEITVTADTTARVITQDAFNVSVEGGTFEGGETTKEVIPGDRYTITANAPEDGKAFAYWYTLDENTAVSAEEEYTFTAEAAVTYHAKFVSVYTLTVTGGTVTGDVEDGKVKENSAVRISLDLSAIPEGKGFTGWKIGDDVSQTAHEIEITVTADTTVEAIYADKVAIFTTPTMSAGKEMLRRNDNYVLDIDRCGTTAFVANVEYVKFYIYTTTFADKADFVGAFKLDNQGGAFRLATMSGEKLWNLEGSAGNIWLDTKDGYHADRKGNFFKMMQTVLGEKFNADTPYYFAAQACGKAGSIYTDSAISEIGPQAFIQNNVASYSVTVTGGTFKGTTVSTATLYEGQQVTIVPADAEKFGGWLINGTQQIETAEYTFAVSGTTDIVAYSNERFTVTVASGGTVNGASTAEVVGGEKVTLAVTDPEEGKAYGWYRTVDGSDVFVCRGTGVDYCPTESVTLTVKVLEKLAAPVNDGNQMFNYESDTCIILDRNTDGTTKKTAFVENVDYVKFYIYSSTEPGAQPIGYMILDRNGAGAGSANCRLATAEGAMLLDLKGGLGNLYLDGTTKDAVRNAFKTALGEEVYNNAEHLYVAAQAISGNPEYDDSELSAIGTVDFKA